MIHHFQVIAFNQFFQCWFVLLQFFQILWVGNKIKRFWGVEFSFGLSKRFQINCIQSFFDKGGVVPACIFHQEPDRHISIGFLF